VDVSTVKNLLIPLGLVITTVISSWAINYLPVIEQSRAKAPLIAKLAVEALIFAVFFNFLEDTLNILQNTDAEKSVKILAQVFVFTLLLFCAQIFYDVLQLLPCTHKSKDITNLDPKDGDGTVESKSGENNKDKQASIRRDKLKRANSFLSQNLEDPTFKTINANFNQLITTPEHRKRASEWVERRANDWIENLQISDYKNCGVTNSNGSEFCNDLRQHLKLLQQNIESGIASSPKKSRERINQSTGSPVPYQHALIDIQTLINRELEQDEKAREWLREEGIQALQRYMQRLIDCVDQ